MIENMLARRYAKVLVEIAQERGQLERVHEELSAFAASSRAAPELQTCWENPLVPPREKARVVDSALTRIGASDALVNFLQLVAEHRRLRLLPRIAQQFEELYDEKTGKAQAKVTSAIKLNQEQHRQLEEALSRFSGKSVRLTLEVDPSLVGGISVRIGDRILDGTIKTKLALLL